MDVLDSRSKYNPQDLLEQRFISEVLREELQELDQRQTSLMSSRGFKTSDFYSERGFTVNDNVGTYTHPLELRFTDMKTRKTSTGKIKKKSHAVHNKPLYGMLNNIVFRLSVEYTQRMKSMLAQKYNIHL
ncbi:hypothetical protein ACFS5M_14110 [Lacinutrix iliipiscaria]|uniref:Uncharacterized protein n=1 Tax=Lacinutrix iliipiscaria TaxID=1230532 RepID=A0ABW5WU44_9FLAO